MFTLPRILAAVSTNPNPKHFLHVIFGSPLQPNFRAPFAVLVASRRTTVPNRPSHPLTRSPSLFPEIPCKKEEKNRISSAKDLVEAPRLSSSSFLPLFVALYGPFLGLWMRMKEVSNNSFTRSAAAFTLAQTDTRDRGGVNYKEKSKWKMKKPRDTVLLMGTHSGER
ncbi:hypothetical protein HDV57DRAFT_19593 [Trichoderma longibrachiatum]|uniref:Uncharacterized protein n=1 Tax=Trichoderma longibrachiatum ATCC 18648 TaxID=983965 RepID=A0A2T4CIX9_TRILO|nr:hypothetical protein M440DRAFT_1396624 [Trichoderma longibrachiatum ATCC 18648]